MDNDPMKVIDLAQWRRERDVKRLQDEEDVGLDAPDVEMMADLMEMEQEIEALPPEQRTPEMLKALEEYKRAYFELF